MRVPTIAECFEVPFLVLDRSAAGNCHLAALQSYK
jgi:hypothetical protein